ncbi:hypothetical protein ABGB12_15135 [Actinocorallia sp. B10E7]|uniref:hypothetical protein n=1 Tax=Actinocorallia sp. B10E7 TaxID=3153558 RepID=UPI00325F40A8
MDAVKKTLGWLVALGLVYLSFVHGLLAVEPTLDAVRGGGTPGVFQIESLSRNAKTGACGWEGTFTSRTGEVRRGVSYVGDEYCGDVEGELHSARDTGARDEVFGGEKTGISNLVFVVLFSLPALFALLILALWGWIGVSWVVLRARGRKSPGGVVPVRGRSIRELRDDPRLTSAQREMLRPRPRTAEPSPRWAPEPLSALPEERRREDAGR